MFLPKNFGKTSVNEELSLPFDMQSALHLFDTTELNVASDGKMDESGRLIRQKYGGKDTCVFRHVVQGGKASDKFPKPGYETFTEFLLKRYGIRDISGNSRLILVNTFPLVPRNMTRPTAVPDSDIREVSLVADACEIFSSLTLPVVK